MSDRVPVGVPRNVEPSASHESSSTFRPFLSAKARIASQSGTLPIRFGTRYGFCPPTDHLGHPVHINVVRVDVDVHEDRGETCPTRGAMSVEKVTAEVKPHRLALARRVRRRDRRRRAGVAHDPTSLPEKLGDATLEFPHVGADAEGLRSTPTAPRISPQPHARRARCRRKELSE